MRRKKRRIASEMDRRDAVGTWTYIERKQNHQVCGSPSCRGFWRELQASAMGGRRARPVMTLLYWLLVGALGVWRIAHLFNAEDGPNEVFGVLRRLAGSGFWGKLLDCFYCLSLWIAAPFAFAIASRWGERLLLWPALSGAAILLERTLGSQTPHGVEGRPWSEDETGGDP
jgi:hypothetical protein